MNLSYAQHADMKFSQERPTVACAQIDRQVCARRTVLTHRREGHSEPGTLLSSLLGPKLILIRYSKAWTRSFSINEDVLHCETTTSRASACQSLGLHKDAPICRPQLDDFDNPNLILLRGMIRGYTNSSPRWVIDG